MPGERSSVPDLMVGVMMRPARCSMTSWRSLWVSSTVSMTLEMPSLILETMETMEKMEVKTHLGMTLTRMAFGMTRHGILLLGTPGELMMEMTTTSQELTSGKMNGQEKMMLTGKSAKPAQALKRYSTSKSGTTTKDIQHEELLRFWDSLHCHA